MSVVMSGNLPIIVGVDPGSTCGWAVLLPGNRDERYYLWRYGQAKPTLSYWVHALLNNVFDKANGQKIIMPIEGQYLPQGFKKKKKKAAPQQTSLLPMPKPDNDGFRMSQKSVIGLVLNRARWQVIGELLGIDVLPVSPLKWQGAMLGATNRVPSEERKRRAKEFVEGFFGLQDLDEHEIDAICVAIHEARLNLVPIAQNPRPDKGERKRGKKG